MKFGSGGGGSRRGGGLPSSYGYQPFKYVPASKSWKQGPKVATNRGCGPLHRLLRGGTVAHSAGLAQHIVTSAQNEKGQPCAVCCGPRLVPLRMTALLLIPSYYIDVWGISVAGTQGPP